MSAVVLCPTCNSADVIALVGSGYEPQFRCAVCQFEWGIRQQVEADRPPKLPSFRKYAEIERLGHDENYGIFANPEDVIVIEEKIDGGNAQFRLWEDYVLFGTRNNHFRLGDASSPQTKQFGANAQWLTEEISKKYPIESWKALLNPDYIYFGEWCKKHTINYNWATMPGFVGFDILNIVTHAYVPYEGMRQEYERLGLPVIPLITRAKVGELDVTRLENFIGKSAYYDGTMEGIVIKNYFRKNVYGRQMFAKLVTQAFKEANMTTFGGGMKKLNDDTAKFLETFYTEARVRKAIFRLRDEGGHPVERGLMHHLPRAVAEDVWKEEAWTIMRGFDNLNFGVIKKMAPKLCLQVLDRVMSERAVPNEN